MIHDRNIRLCELTSESVEMLYGPLSDLLFASGLEGKDVEDVLQYTRDKIWRIEQAARRKAEPGQQSGGMLVSLNVPHIGLSRKLTPVSDSDTPNSARGNEKAEQILARLISSETKYVSILEDVIVKKFMEPMVKLRGAEQKGIMGSQMMSVFLQKHEITAEDIKPIFANVADLIEVHKSILERIKAVPKDGQVANSLAKIFADAAPQLKKYSVYLQNYRPSLRRIARLRKKSKALDAQITTIEATCAEDQGDDIRKLLGIPLNRLASYIRALKRLQECMQAGDPTQAAAVHRALVSIEGVEMHLSQAVRHSESQNALKAIAQRLVCPEVDIVVPDRLFLHEAACVWQMDKCDPNPSGYIFLFSDIILLCTSRRGHPSPSDPCEVSHQVPLKEMQLVHEGNSIALSCFRTNQKVKLTFVKSDDTQTWLKWMDEAIKDAGISTEVFGVPLAVLMSRETEMGEIPAVLESAFNVLRERHCDVEGLFRKNASGAELQGYQRTINAGEPYALEAAEPHTVCGIIKMYFRALPVPILSPVFYDFLAVCEKYETDEKMLVRELRKLLSKLDPNSQAVLRHLMIFLHDLSAHADKTRMPLSNLALVFAPNILSVSHENSEEEAKLFPKIKAALTAFAQVTPQVYASHNHK